MIKTDSCLNNAHAHHMGQMYYACLTLTYPAHNRTRSDTEKVGKNRLPESGTQSTVSNLNVSHPESTVYRHKCFTVFK